MRGNFDPSPTATPSLFIIHFSLLTPPPSLPLWGRWLQKCPKRTFLKTEEVKSQNRHPLPIHEDGPLLTTPHQSTGFVWRYIVLRKEYQRSRISTALVYHISRCHQNLFHNNCLKNRIGLYGFRITQMRSCYVLKQRCLLQKIAIPH